VDVVVLVAAVCVVAVFERVFLIEKGGRGVGDSNLRTL
jgi:hypothetical protein